MFEVALVVVFFGLVCVVWMVFACVPGSLLFCFYWILVLGECGFNSVVGFIDLPGIKMCLVL